MFFDLQTGKESNSGSTNCIWYDDDFLRVSSANGFCSILMPLNFLNTFILFLKGTKASPKGLEFDTYDDNHISFDSDAHDSFGGKTTTNISIGTNVFDIVFNIDLTNIDSLVNFLESKR